MSVSQYRIRRLILVFLLGATLIIFVVVNASVLTGLWAMYFGQPDVVCRRLIHDYSRGFAIILRGTLCEMNVTGNSIKCRYRIANFGVRRRRRTNFHEPAEVTVLLDGRIVPKGWEPPQTAILLLQKYGNSEDISTKDMVFPAGYDASQCILPLPAGVRKFDYFNSQRWTEVVVLSPRIHAGIGPRQVVQIFEDTLETDLSQASHYIAMSMDLGGWFVEICTTDLLLKGYYVTNSGRIVVLGQRILSNVEFRAMPEERKRYLIAPYKIGSLEWAEASGAESDDLMPGTTFWNHERLQADLKAVWSDDVGSR